MSTSNCADEDCPPLRSEFSHGCQSLSCHCHWPSHSRLSSFHPSQPSLLAQWSWLFPRLRPSPCFSLHFRASAMAPLAVQMQSPGLRPNVYWHRSGIVAISVVVSAIRAIIIVGITATVISNILIIVSINVIICTVIILTSFNQLINYSFVKVNTRVADNFSAQRSRAGSHPTIRQQRSEEKPRLQRSGSLCSKSPRLRSAFL